MKPSAWFRTPIGVRLIGGVAALAALGSGAGAMPVSAARVATTAAGHASHVTLRPAGPRAAALHTLRHLDVPTNIQGVVARHAAEARARAVLAGSGLDGAVVAEPSGQMAVDMPVALGSGGDDVLVLTLPDSRPSTLSLRSGHTGATRWAVTLADAWTVGVARLGSPRRLAAVVYQTAFTGAPDPSGLENTGDQDNSVVAVDLVTGKTDWTSSVVHGTYADNPAGFSEAAALYPAGILHDRSGDRVLGALVTQSYGAAGDALAQQPVVFDGATGAMTPLGAATGADAYGYMEPAGDLNGDGLTDVIQVAGGDASAVVVDSGTAGPPLWAKPTVPAYFVDAVPAPDLDGDHHDDIVVAADTGPTGGASVITAYTGTGGATLWSRNGDIAIPLGVVAGRGVVGVISFFGALSMEAVAGKGTSLWRRTIDVPLGGSGGMSIEFGDGGDADGDGVRDLFADVIYMGSAGSGHFMALISGRTGKVHTGASVGEPIYGSLDGHGDDFLQVANARSSVTLSGYDGVTRHRLWRVTLPGAGGRSPFVAGADAVALAGRGRSLVLDLWDGTRTELLAFGGRSGHRLWTQKL